MMHREYQCLLIFFLIHVNLSKISSNFPERTSLDNDTEVERKENECRENSSCSRDSIQERHTKNGIDIKQFLKAWDNPKNESNKGEDDYQYNPLMAYNFEPVSDIKETNWRVNYPSIEQRNRYMLDKNLFTDCTFEIGSGNNSEIFSAHKVFFARASPVFEAIFEETSEDKIIMTEMTPQIFEKLLTFVYTGGMCLETYSQACEMLHIASQLQISELMQHCRAFLWTNLYPRNAWRGFQCAQAANDEVLKEAALQIIAWRTEDAIKDPAFTDITQSKLVEFLKRDDLNVTSEVKLYEASLRWAMSEAARQGLPQEPESLRKVLGPAIGFIRFFKFTPSEFANMQSTSKVLTYSESLSIIFNLNSPGVISIPSYLSSNNNSRGIIHPHAYFKVLASSGSTCYLREENINALSKNTFNLYTTHSLNINENLKLIGIQIPTQIHCRTYLQSDNVYKVEKYVNNNTYYTSYVEDITVYILNNNSIVNSTHFKGTVKCNSLITIKFIEPILLQQYELDKINNYQFKIILHKSGRYPVSWSHDTDSRYRYRDYLGGCSVYYWYFNEHDFVHSMITESN